MQKSPAGLELTGDFLLTKLLTNRPFNGILNSGNEVDNYDC